MTSEFKHWLLALGTQRVDLPPAVRGLPVSHTITYSGNVTTAALAGAVKAAPDTTAELATFTIGTPSFADGVTTWVVSLSGAQTAALPADGNFDGLVELVYDFILTPSGGSPARLFGGAFTLSGFVTEPA